MSNGNGHYVSEEHLHRVLTKVNHVLQAHSQAIANLQHSTDSKEPDEGQTYQNTNRIAQIEAHLDHIREDLQQLHRSRETRQPVPTQAPTEREDYSSQIRDIESRLVRIERIEKEEEYDQTRLERDFDQLQREFETLQRDFETAQRQIRNMQKQLKSRR